MARPWIVCVKSYKGVFPQAPTREFFSIAIWENGRFQDVTLQAGLSNPYWATGANAADFDNDGQHGHSRYYDWRGSVIQEPRKRRICEVGKTRRSQPPSGLAYRERIW